MSPGSVPGATSGYAAARIRAIPSVPAPLITRAMPLAMCPSDVVAGSAQESSSDSIRAVARMAGAESPR